MNACNPLLQLDTMERRLLRSAAVVVLICATVTSQALADSVTYNFTGTVVHLDFIEGDPPLGNVTPQFGDTIVGTVTYDLDAPGTPFAFGGGNVVLGIDYASRVPPARMTFAIQGLTVDATVDSDVHVLAGVDLPSNLEGVDVDEVIFAMDTSVPSSLSVVLRVEDTSRTVLRGPDLPAWIPLERFDLRRFEVYQIPGGTGHLFLTATVHTLTPVARSAPIDVRPGKFPNRVNPRSAGVLPVAVFTIPPTQGQREFDALKLNPTTIRFGESGVEAAPVRSVRKDIDGDGYKDLLLFFRIADMQVSCTTISGMLTGVTFRKQLVRGADSIRTPSCVAD
jgi:hypothetical protein